MTLHTKKSGHHAHHPERKILNWLEHFDERAIKYVSTHGNLLARIALFIIFFWFGVLKVFALSPADPLVGSLVEMMFGNLISPEVFSIWFGAFEALLGILILVPRFARITTVVLILHLIATAAPLAVLPTITWEGFMQPTLIGQYIIKNLALLVLALFIYARMKPMSTTHSVWAEKNTLE